MRGRPKSSLALDSLAATAQLTPKMRQAVEHELDGWSTQEIADYLRTTPRTIQAWRGVPAYRDALRLGLANVRELAQEELTKIVPEATRTMGKAVKGALSPRTANVQLKATQWVLESAGLGPVTKSVNLNANLQATVTPESVAASLSRLLAPQTRGLTGLVSEGQEPKDNTHIQDVTIVDVTKDDTDE